MVKDIIISYAMVIFAIVSTMCGKLMGISQWCIIISSSGGLQNQKWCYVREYYSNDWYQEQEVPCIQGEMMSILCRHRTYINKFKLLYTLIDCSLSLT